MTRGQRFLAKEFAVVTFRVPALLVLLALASCSKRSDFIEEGGVYTQRSSCPILGIPTGTGDITLFDPPNSQSADAIDVEASITNAFTNCTDTGSEIQSNVGFDVVATRRDSGPARRVVLQYFNVVVQGGNQIVAKRIGQIPLDFAAGSPRAAVRWQAVAKVDRAATSLPENVREILTRPRKAGDTEAAVDPMTDPAVRTAVARATFEHLIGFQMSQDQLRFNATR